MCKTCFLSKIIFALDIVIVASFLVMCVLYFSGYTIAAEKFLSAVNSMVVIDLILRVRRLEKNS